MLHAAVIEQLAETLPLEVTVNAVQRSGAGAPARFVAAPASSMKKPWVVVVNDVALMDSRCQDLRYASESAAVAAGQRYVKAIVDATLGYYRETVEVTTGVVLDHHFSKGFGSDRVGTRACDTPGHVYRVIAVYKTPSLETSNA